MTSSISIPDLSVAMWRMDLKAVPRYELPQDSPFCIVPYERGMEKEWTGVQQRADAYNEIDSTLFFNTFNKNEKDLRQRVLFLIDDSSRVVGSSAAWMGKWPNNHPSEKAIGRIHWVAIDPEYQRQGLSKPLLSRTCQKLRELNHDKTYLTTSIVRIPAIRLYLSFGFYPALLKDSDYERWRMIQSMLPSPLFGMTEKGEIHNL
jgi:GNAT superfamily N-acetyltransferase